MAHGSVNYFHVETTVVILEDNNFSLKWSAEYAALLPASKATEQECLFNSTYVITKGLCVIWIDFHKSDVTDILRIILCGIAKCLTLCFNPVSNNLTLV